MTMKIKVKTLTATRTKMKASKVTTTATATTDAMDCEAGENGTYEDRDDKEGAGEPRLYQFSYYYTSHL